MNFLLMMVPFCIFNTRKGENIHGNRATDSLFPLAGHY
jgi:hypothetical protein